MPARLVPVALVAGALAIMSGLVFLLNWGRYGAPGVLGGLALVAAGLALTVRAFGRPVARDGTAAEPVGESEEERRAAG